MTKFTCKTTIKLISRKKSVLMFEKRIRKNPTLNMHVPPCQNVFLASGRRFEHRSACNAYLQSWRWGDDSSSDVLPLEGGPHALAKMAEDTVAVSVPDARRLVLVHVSPRSRLARVQTWATRRRLYGLVFLGQGKMAASCPWDKLIEIRTVSVWF